MSEDHRPRQMVITQADMWSNERIAQIAADVAGSAMSVEAGALCGVVVGNHEVSKRLCSWNLCKACQDMTDANL